MATGFNDPSFDDQLSAPTVKMTDVFDSLLAASVSRSVVAVVFDVDSRRVASTAALSDLVSAAVARFRGVTSSATSRSRRGTLRSSNLLPWFGLRRRWRRDCISAHSIRRADGRRSNAAAERPLCVEAQLEMPINEHIREYCTASEHLPTTRDLPTVDSTRTEDTVLT